MTKEEVKECVENLCIKLTIVENNRLLYKELTKLVGKGKQYECILKASICFWTLTVSNLRYSLFSELAKLYDEQKDSFGIKKLINVCSQNSDWFSEGCDEYEITHIELMREL